MTRIRDAVATLQHRLRSHGIPDDRLETDLLLMTALVTDRASLYARLSDPLPPDVLGRLEALVERRLRREPMAYLMGYREFYGLSFHVGPGVFIPRPETELLVEDALAIAQKCWEQRRSTVVDVGAGTGAIGITLALHMPRARVIAIDVSVQALHIADLNRRRHGVADRVALVRGDLLGPVRVPVDMVVSNPPYVRSADLPTLEPEIRLHEPQEALDGGPDGLDVIRRLIPQATQMLRPGGALVMELSPQQASGAKVLVEEAFPDAVAHLSHDLAGLARALVVEKR